jgi:outer membrane protein OmpA-like peptidoglycan-associated protein
MRAFVPLTPFILWLMLLASCSSPPKPPTVDDSRRRPVNTATAVELQACKIQLQNTRLSATEAERLANTVTATLSGLAARQAAPADLSKSGSHPVGVNLVFSVRFEYGATRVDVQPDDAKVLITEAKEAPLIFLRGRTDGLADSQGESRIARERAAAVRDYLVDAGVDPSRIRTTYQPAGDHVADNTDLGGRALNRRVEIEIYRALPAALNTGTAAR